MIRYGLDGKGKGKKGSSVFSINHGVQIEREYNGSVSNPSTPDQVSQRSRFALASQVSAAMEPVIVIPRKGMQSPRNRFVKRNMGFFYGDSNGAQVTYENLQITAGASPLPAIFVGRSGGNELEIQLQDRADQLYTHVCYCVFKRNDNGTLYYVYSVIVERGQQDGEFWYSGEELNGDIFVFAYGFKAKNAKAKAKYSRYNIENGKDFASLLATRVLEPNDFMFSETRGATLPAGASEIITPGESQVMLYLTLWNPGNVALKVNNVSTPIAETGGNAIPLGATVELTASDASTPAMNYIFDGWYNNGEQEPISTNRTLTLTANTMLDIVAKFRAEPPGLE
jgi:hypothetical protein